MAPESKKILPAISSSWPVNSSSLKWGPHSRTAMRAPSAHSGASALATVPPPAPEPMIRTSNSVSIGSAFARKLVRAQANIALQPGGRVTDPLLDRLLTVVSEVDQCLEAPQADAHQTQWEILQTMEQPHPPPARQQGHPAQPQQEQLELQLLQAGTRSQLIVDS